MNSSLDTNILLRYIWRDVPSQQASVNRLFDDTSQRFYISDMVVAELIFNLQNDKMKHNEIVDILMKIFEKKNVVVSDFVMETVLPFYAEHPALSFVDCYAAFEAERKGWEPLYTFDKKLANQHPSAKMA
ncbi:PIN domain-containing protein [Candidatus Saccharibacteria bacterium]|nr:PIN domain-containing protein [Candidatus Saccharibacteria bacterium]MBQ6375599.1 PIN domain-containing protein [Candidatus Saccharibacteria bacterium]